MPTLLKNNALPRRTFLRGYGVGLSLPLLDAMRPAVLSAAEKACGGTGASTHARHLQQPGICYPKSFFRPIPARTTRCRPTCKHCNQHRDDFTVFSGVWHPDVDGGHPADICFLTAAPHPGSGGFRNTISLDQYVAEHVGHLTRFPSMTLGVNVKQGPTESVLDRCRRADSV